MVGQVMYGNGELDVDMKGAWGLDTGAEVERGGVCTSKGERIWSEVRIVIGNVIGIGIGKRFLRNRGMWTDPLSCV